LREPARLEGVVGARRLARAAAGVDGADGVLARVAARIGVGEELRDELDVEPRLFLRLAPAGVADLLAIVDEAARQRPAARLVLAQDEDDAPVGAGDDRVRRRLGVLVLLAHGTTRPGVGSGAAGCSIRPRSAWVNRARQKGLVASP